MNNKLILLLTGITLLSSCTNSGIDQIVSAATGGIIRTKEGLDADKSAQPASIKLSKSGQVVKLDWRNGTPYAINLEIVSSTKGIKQGENSYWFSPMQSKHYNLTVDFTKKTYELAQFDGAQLPTEYGTISY